MLTLGHMLKYRVGGLKGQGCVVGVFGGGFRGHGIRGFTAEVLRRKRASVRPDQALLPAIELSIHADVVAEEEPLARYQSLYPGIVLERSAHGAWRLLQPVAFRPQYEKGQLIFAAHMRRRCLHAPRHPCGERQHGEGRGLAMNSSRELMNRSTAPRKLSTCERAASARTKSSTACGVWASVE